ncbi:SAM-dependent chlorinase/fluorinase [Candidatus Methanocrinis natronophilus]|uniref:SAM-dependent chlorinase/fluorinase n=1 Tax=Candidatus Methanocrinis natronophilus TaxID=3033396 RepID=A0ABT5X4I7_9EURY|nr:SAM-dependent chlorinase/fluorinase [Candidatus Methanocrinis natronophilus]MDF0589612.1 SAM-dependent chlorinase/fluorinase [Candidatus Methanocrinis natronophilus]
MARLSTITHQVSAFDVAEGSYILAQAAWKFPPGTVFAAEVDPGVGGGARAIVLETADGKIFIAPDNGLFSGVMDDLGIASIRVITDPNLTAKGKTAPFEGLGSTDP